MSVVPGLGAAVAAVVPVEARGGIVALVGVVPEHDDTAGAVVVGSAVPEGNDADEERDQNRQEIGESTHHSRTVSVGRGLVTRIFPTPAVTSR